MFYSQERTNYSAMALYLLDMAHISRHILSKKVKENIDKQLIEVLSKRWTRNAKSSVLYEIITDTERTMLAKRVSIIAMIAAGCSSYEIINALGVGSQTVARFTQKYKDGDFKNVVRILDRDEENNNSTGISDTVELFLRGGIMPSRTRMRSRSFKKMESTQRAKKKRRANPEN